MCPSVAVLSGQGAARIAFELFDQFAAGDRAVEQITLARITVMAEQVGQLFSGFNTLGNLFELEVVGHGNHGGGDFHVVLVVGDVFDKAAVDLDDVDREFFQVTER